MKIFNMLNKYYMNSASDGSESGGGGGSTGDTKDAGDSVTLSRAEYEQFQALIAGKKEESKPDAYTQLKNSEQQEQDNAAQVEKHANAIVFDKDFDSFIESNAGMFSFTADKLREGVVSLEGLEKSQALKQLAAKDFFAKESNLSLLQDAEKSYVKDHIVGKSDRTIDADKAWSLIESALHVHRAIQYRTRSPKTNSNNSLTPNLDKFWDDLNTRGQK